jgi:antitoxin MazE
MQLSLSKIGNSKGLRIPKVVLQQTGITDIVNLVVEDNKLIISPVKETRKGWEEAFIKMHEQEDDFLLEDDAIANLWDDEEWKY